MSIGALLIVALAAAGSMIWLLNYVPLVASVAGRKWSPRLLLCKLLAPFDAALTTVLVIGPILGFGMAVTGIGMTIYTVIVAVGLSVGIVITKKLFVPHWRTVYLKEKGMG